MNRIYGIMYAGIVLYVCIFGYCANYWIP